MRNPKNEIAMMALKDAADEAGSDANKMSSDGDMDQTLCCPKCGYKAPESKFELQTNNEHDTSNDTGQDGDTSPQED